MVIISINVKEIKKKSIVVHNLYAILGNSDKTKMYNLYILTTKTSPSSALIYT